MSYKLLLLSKAKVSQIPTDYIGYWPLIGGVATDESGNGNNGVIDGAVTTDWRGVPDSAFDFDGINDDIRTNLQFSALSAITISYWCYNRDLDSFRTVWANPTTPATVNGFAAYYQVGTLLTIRNGGSTWQIPHNMLVNNWYNLIIRYDGIDFKLYTNGILSGTSPAAGLAINGTVGLMFGNYDNSTSSGDGVHHDGKISAFRVYDYAMDDEGIAALAAE